MDNLKGMARSPKTNPGLWLALKAEKWLSQISFQFH